MPLTPSLAGQHSFYAITQLFLFREGRRSNEAMTAMAKGMSDADMRAFSEVIAKLPPPVGPNIADLDAARMASGATLAKQHRCASCHGADYSGDKQVARIANQREDYLLLALRDFQSGKRLGYTAAMNETLVGIAPDAYQCEARQCFAPDASAAAREVASAVASGTFCVGHPERCCVVTLHSAVIQSWLSFSPGIW
jgi:cytochrome c553